RLRGVLEVVVLAPERVETDVPRAADIGGGLREGEGHPLELPDRLTECFPVARPLECLVEGLLGSAEAREADDGARVVEALHDRDEAVPLGADETIRR